MKSEYIRTFEGVILGIIETDKNGDQIARAFPGRQVLGYYRKKRDVTTDFYGRVIGRGNIIASLITNKK